MTFTHTRVLGFMQLDNKPFLIHILEKFTEDYYIDSNLVIILATSTSKHLRFDLKHFSIIC